MHFSKSRWDDFIKIKIWTWATIWRGIVLMDWMVLWKSSVDKVRYMAVFLSFPYDWCPTLFSLFSIMIRNSMDPVTTFILNFSADFKIKDGFMWRRSGMCWRMVWWTLTLVNRPDGWGGWLYCRCFFILCITLGINWNKVGLLRRLAFNKSSRLLTLPLESCWMAQLN